MLRDQISFYIESSKLYLVFFRVCSRDGKWG
jgi:hypothetical protein